MAISIHTLSHLMLLLLILIGAPTFMLQCLFYSRLRRDHAGVWERLGKPGTFNGGWLVVLFLWRREYRSFPEAVARLAAWYRMGLIVFMVVFVPMLTAFIFAIWHQFRMR